MMETTLTDIQKHHLRLMFDRGAESASLALSRWLNQHVRLEVSAVEQAELNELAGVLGEPDELIAVCSMELTGALPGRLLLAFDDSSGLVLADLLMGQPPGTSKTWGEIEQSAALETTNIVGCAFLNAIAERLPTVKADESLVPAPPVFLREYAACVVESALMEQAIELDRALLIESRFHAEGAAHPWNWTLLLVPTAEAVRGLLEALNELEPS